LYLKFGYASLFEYLTQHIGYANGSAQRRIDAARLAIYVPKVVVDLESGDLNLSQVALLQKSIRAIQSDSKTKVDQKTKENLVDLLSNKSFAESEVLVAHVLDIAPMETTRVTNQKDESVRLQVTLTKSQWEKLLKMRELLSNTIPGGSNWGQVFEYAADKVIKLKDKSAQSTKTTEFSVALQNDSEKISDNRISKPQHPNQPLQSQQKSPSSQARQHIPVSVQRQVFQRDQCCQYIDKVTGKKCESKWHLQIDHIQPVWANGSIEIENLRLLCAGHNQEIYRWQANIVRHH
jgi:5-methylcytosine-specific restriction endonuclease McrA